jgi:hypothetical protein
MKRAINVPALIFLIIACVLTGGVVVLLWQATQVPPHEIRCSHGNHSVMSCDTNFGNYMIFVALVAAPIIAGLAHKAFFTQFKRSK